MKTILVPLDGSALAEQVLPYVRLLAPILCARVRLLRIIEAAEHDDVLHEVFPLLHGTGEVPERMRARVEEARRHVRESAEGYLATHAMLLRGTGLEVSADVFTGSPADLIVEIAESTSATLIAMATHGYSGLKRWAVGSVTDKVVHAATTPVLVVRGQPQASPVAPALRRILVPLDSSPFARQALPLATELAARAGAKLTLLEAIGVRRTPELERLDDTGLEPDSLGLELARQAQERLETLVAGLRAEGVLARAVVQIGSAAEVIVEQIAHERPDLVVMATHGYSGFKRWTLGSVADKVLHASTAPLLLVRPKQ